MQPRRLHLSPPSSLCSTRGVQSSGGCQEQLGATSQLCWGFGGSGAALAGLHGAFPCQRQGEANSLGEYPVENWEAASHERTPVTLSAAPPCLSGGRNGCF